jgi:hypothetical protein
MRRSQNVEVIAAKRPRPMDSARYLNRHYAEQEKRADQLATKYVQTVVTATQAVPT